MDATEFAAKASSIVGNPVSKPPIPGAWKSMEALANDHDLRIEALFREATQHFDRRIEIIRITLLHRGFNKSDPRITAGAFHYTLTNGSSASARLEPCGRRIYFRVGLPFQSRSYMEEVACLTSGPVYTFRMSTSQVEAGEEDVLHEPAPSIAKMQKVIDDHIILFLHNLVHFIQIDAEEDG
jgi:hypothetical protein